MPGFVWKLNNCDLGSNLTLTVTYIVTLTYFAGVPAVRLLWTRVGSMTVLHEGPELVFDPAGLQDNDEYICRPTNQVGDGTPTTWKFIVNGQYLSLVVLFQ